MVNKHFGHVTFYAADRIAADVWSGLICSKVGKNFYHSYWTCPPLVKNSALISGHWLLLAGPVFSKILFAICCVLIDWWWHTDVVQNVSFHVDTFTNCRCWCLCDAVYSVCLVQRVSSFVHHTTCMPKSVISFCHLEKFLILLP